MNALRKFGIYIVVMVIALTGCNNQKSNNGSKNTTTSSEVNSTKASTDCDYTDKLFDTSYVHTINIDIADEDWEDLLKNAMDETYYSCNLTIDGESYDNVGLRAKGNSSLSQVANSDSDRYSFKINFDKYDEEQNYYGLEKLALNNIIQDSTFMKDYLSYKMMSDFGVAAPYVSYSYITINGKEWGLYLNVETIEESFLDRNYGEDHGELYKPSTDMEMNMDKKGQQDPPNANNTRKVETDETKTQQEEKENTQPNQSEEQTNQQSQVPGNMPEDFDPTNMPEGGQGMGKNKEAKGADLKYVDDKLESYSNIFDNAETKVDDTDKTRLVNSLKQLSEGQNLEEVVDLEATLRYFVVHNFVDNYDSYTGNMLHNYYLYEADGKLSMLPWDYNLGFGAFSMDGKGMGGPHGQDNKENIEATNKEIDQANGNETTQGKVTSTEKKMTTQNTGKETDTTASATKMINMAIDTPLSGTTEEDRPMWSQLINNESNKEMYHQLFDEFLRNYLENGAVEQEIDRVSAMISPYIQKDPTAFYTYEEFQNGVSTLKSFITLRTQSIRKQLTGEIPTTTEEQNSVPNKLVDASNISINDMGTNKMEGPSKIENSNKTRKEK